MVGVGWMSDKHPPLANPDVQGVSEDWGGCRPFFIKSSLSGMCAYETNGASAPDSGL